jgi:PBP1b-binding outer membrane lipoprotein LpoB
MTGTKLLISVVAILVLSSCVQKSSEKTIIVKLNVQDMEHIESVGIRGNENPLSWDYDMELVPVIKDSLYTATFSLITGYKFTEVKFTVNGQFELNDQDNRKIFFSENDTTVYEAIFNQLNN